MSDFLFEVGLEEIPARMIAGAQAELLKRTLALLVRERLLAEAEPEAHSYSTPRRLAVYVEGVLERQPELTEELLGPATKIAYKDGVPGPAALAFAKKSGVAVEDLRTASTPKGDYLAATSTRPGRTAAEVLTTELPKDLAGIYWAKNMYWRAGKPERFVRPVRWLVALLDDRILPVEFAGYTAGRETYGHRVLFGAQPIVLVQPSDYAAKLKDAHVMADVELRRHIIRKALDQVCRTIPDTRWREDHALVDKMTHMTEWPSVIAGGFDPAYLALPEEVLVTVMRDHQNYFAVESSLLSSRSEAEGSASELRNPLAPHFLAVLNTEADESGQAIIRHGNARVLRARFNDAKFFWEFDQRTPLEDRVALLENVTFQKDLGSYAAKSLRVGEVCRVLARKLNEAGTYVDEPALWTAARLAKTDLTAELVKEFTELQGEIGGLYATAQGFEKAAAAAIYDQYRPTSMEDRIPRTVEGQLLAIADKADTIAGLFALGMEPTGSKDPFALRRAANGIVKILAESRLSLRLSDVVTAASAQTTTSDNVSVFLIARLQSYLSEVLGVSYDVVRAVFGAFGRLPDDVRDVLARANALSAAKDSEDFLAVCAAFKRMKGIVDQARAKGELDSIEAADPQGEVAPQQMLFQAADRVANEVDALSRSYNYPAALGAIATLRAQIDAFMDGFQIRDPNQPLTTLGRLRLLDLILSRFRQIADFSEIVTAG